MITLSHPFAALGAYYQALQQGGPFSRWTLLALGAQRLGIVAQALDILLVFHPGETRRDEPVRFRDQLGGLLRYYHRAPA